MARKEKRTKKKRKQNKPKPPSCCQKTTRNNQCRRTVDGKIFSLPRRFSRKQCQRGIKGFTMRSSCAPFKGCVS
jgi:hypothetical protein